MQSLCIKVVTDIADAVVAILTVAVKTMTKTTIIAAVANAIIILMNISMNIAIVVNSNITIIKNAMRNRSRKLIKSSV